MTFLTKYGPVLAVVVSVSALRADDAAPPPAIVSDAQMEAESSRIDGQIKADYRELLQLRESARQQKDVIRLNCVNTRLIEVKAHMNIAEGIAQQLRAAIEQNSEERHDLFAKLTSTFDSISRLRDEARACVGPNEILSQDSGASVTEPELPDDPTTEDPFRADIEPPAYASPFF